MSEKRSDIYRHFEPLRRPVPFAAPGHDYLRHQHAQLRMIADLVWRMNRNRRPPPGTAAAPIPADPDKPNTLSGGAAAPLEFD